MAPQNTVTVTGSDRAKLLADLTVRLGRVEVVEEHQVQLGDAPHGAFGYAAARRRSAAGARRARVAGTTISRRNCPV